MLFPMQQGEDIACLQRIVQHVHLSQGRLQRPISGRSRGGRWPHRMQRNIRHHDRQLNSPGSVCSSLRVGLPGLISVQHVWIR
jgi:hypothetical protein